jgi:hypothetical protein
MKRRLVVSLLTGVGLGMLLLLFAPRDNPLSEAPTLALSANTAAATVTAVALQPPRLSPAPGSTLQQQLAPLRPTTPKVPASRARRWSEPLPEPAFAQFSDWTRRYLSQPSPESRKALEAEGQELARLRRQDMAELIPADPRRALELAIPQGLRDQLPASITPFLEEPVDGRGDFGVLAGIPAPEHTGPFEAVYRTVSLGDRAWRAYTYGSALLRPTLTDVPLHGIALGALFALDPNAVRVLDPDEAARMATPAQDALCAVSNEPVTTFAEEVPVDAGGHTAWLCSAAHTEHYNERLILASVDKGNGTDADGVFRQKSAYTEGLKRLLILRVDFSDLAGAPLSDATGTNMLNGIAAFYLEQSFGKTTFRPLGAGSAMTATLRMPKTAAVYGASDPSILRTDARNAARTAGVTLAQFDFDLICVGPVPGFNWAGLGYVGAPGSWIRASFDAAGGVSSHELGHNFGLNHANAWDTGGQSILGAGSNVEYGDSFDTMGNATAGRRHFNARYKNYLDWLPTTQVRIVTASGLYRVFAHDATNAATPRAVRIARNTQTNYWLEFRQKFTDRPALMDGIGLRWARSGNQQSLLLDVTPGSPDGKNDSALLIGRTFSDRAAGIHITPVSKGGTVPESLDLQVNLGKFTNNLLPTVTLTASTTSTFSGAPVTFTATASDPDGDTLAYSWDFGDNAIVAANTNRVSRSWGTARDYWVRCTVSDMKGGEGSAAVLVRIGNPGTFRVSGRVTQGGKPVAGVRVEVSNTQQTYSVSDGSYTLTGLSRGNYTLKAIGEGYLFTPSGFSNPLSVTANVEGANLEASQPGDLAQVSLVPLGAQWHYYDNGDLAGTLWRTPGFNEGTWTKGAAPLGYGDDNIVTTVKSGPSSNAKHITTWFRHRFWVDDPARFLAVTVGLIRDDGAAVYLNGTEIFRSNLPTGTLTAATRASASVGGTDETTVFEATVDPKWFRVGTNVLAVEVHQYAPDSSDLRFALQLNGLLRPSSAKSPRLEFTAGSEQLRLSWPVTAVGFELQETKSLTTPWFLSDETISAEAGQNVAAPRLTDDLRFFRLGSP